MNPSEHSGLSWLARHKRIMVLVVLGSLFAVVVLVFFAIVSPGGQDVQPDPLPSLGSQNIVMISGQQSLLKPAEMFYRNKLLVVAVFGLIVVLISLAIFFVMKSGTVSKFKEPQVNLEDQPKVEPVESEDLHIGWIAILGGILLTVGIVSSLLYSKIYGKSSSSDPVIPVIPPTTGPTLAATTTITTLHSASTAVTSTPAIPPTDSPKFPTDDQKAILDEALKHEKKWKYYDPIGQQYHIARLLMYRVCDESIANVIGLPLEKLEGIFDSTQRNKINMAISGLCPSDVERIIVMLQENPIKAHEHIDYDGLSLVA